MTTVFSSELNITWNVLQVKQQKHAFFCVCFQVTSPLVWNRKCRLWAAMGQSAALLLSELLLLLLTASRTLLAVSFPEDTVPLDVVDAHCEYTHTHTQMSSAETGYRLRLLQRHWKSQQLFLNIHFLLSPVTHGIKTNTGSLLLLVVSAVQTLACHIYSNKINLLYGQL